MSRWFLTLAVAVATAVACCHAHCDPAKVADKADKCGKQLRDFSRKASSHSEETEIVCCLNQWAMDCAMDALKETCPDESEMDLVKDLLEGFKGAAGAECPSHLSKHSCKSYLKKVGAGAPQIAVPTVLCGTLALLLLFLFK